MIVTIKSERNEFFGHHLQNQFDVAKVKRSFSQDRLAREERFGYLFGNAHCPCVMRVTRIDQCHQEAGVRDSSHFFENPLRVDKLRGPPRMTPANRMNLRAPLSPCRARSRWSRINFPWDTPIRAAVCSIQPASFFVGRKVIV